MVVLCAYQLSVICIKEEMGRDQTAPNKQTSLVIYRRIKGGQVSISKCPEIKAKRQRVEWRDMVAIIGGDVYQPNDVNHDSGRANAI